MPSYIVGLGASAGGLETLMALIPQLKANGKVSYLIAQHMAHDGHSDLMVRLLNRGNVLPVFLAEDQQKLLPDHIYLIPAGKDGTIHSGHISLSIPHLQNKSTPSVNVLFNSIAKAYQKNAVGVVLSGTGSDGAIGSATIKANGGVTIAQLPSSAIFNGMPTSAIESGGIESILTLEAIADALNMIVPRQRAPLNNDAMIKNNKPSMVLTTLIDRINKDTSIDFSGYKEETLWRRLDTRMSSLGIQSYEGYLSHLTLNSSEVIRIQQLFLVSFSSFFRDVDSFESLKTAMRQKIRTKQFEGVFTIWVPACASGEEAYTLAIIASEIKSELGLNLTIKIIGVDLNPSAIDQASSGIYSSKIVKDMKPHLLGQYFSHYEDEFKVAETLKSICEFHIGDIFNYLPTKDLDLISCRNLLIYLKGPEQDKLIRKFYEHLNANGLLFIGQSEMLSPASSPFFHQIDLAHNLFTKH